MTPERTVIKEKKIVVDTPRRSASFAQNTTPSPQEEANKELALDTRPAIVYIITRADWGDAQKNLYALCEYFGGDYQLHVIYGAYEYHGSNIMRDTIESLDSDITLHPLTRLTDQNILFNELRVIWQLVHLIHDIDPQVIHAYDAKSTCLIGIARRLIRQQSRFISSVYRLVDTQHRLSFAERILRWIYARIYSAPDALVVADEYVLSQAQAQLAGIDRVHLIRPGIIEIDFLDPKQKRMAMAGDAPERLQQKINDPQTILLGNISPLEPEHNLSFILQAIAQLQDAGHQFVYFHYGEGSQRALLEHEITQFGLEDCVILKGHDSMAERYLSVFDIVVHPSSDSGVPAVLSAAALARKAVILSPTPGLEDAVEDEKEVAFVDARNAQALARTLVHLIEHPEKRRKMGLALEQRIRADYQIEEMRRRTRELYGVG